MSVAETPPTNHHTIDCILITREREREEGEREEGGGEGGRGGEE